MKNITVNHPNGSLTLEELQADVNAAKQKGLSERWAFTPETVQCLIDKINQLQNENSNFNHLSYLASTGKEGLVFLGCGGDLQEWISGINEVLNEEGIGQGTFEEKFSEVNVTQSTGGRTDLTFVFCLEPKLDLGRLAMWRLRFGQCSWLSDFVVNYRDQYGLGNYENSEI